MTSRVGGSYAGMTLNSFTSVSLDPLLVLVSLAHGTRTLEMVRRCDRFAVNVLHRRQRDVAMAFAKPGAPFRRVTRSSIRPGIWSSCTRSPSCAARSRDPRPVTTSSCVGEVVDFEGSGGEPLIFHRGAFGGSTPTACSRGRVIGFAGSGW